MKLVGIRRNGTVEVAILDGDAVHPLGADFWSDVDAALARPSSPVPLSSVELVPPVPPSARVICVGLNYRAHAAEGSFTVPEHPTLFGRWTASLSVDGSPASVPSGEAGLDWEGEVAAHIGRTVRDASESEALQAILGYSTFNDLTARRAQKLTSQWTLGKNADGSGPMGPIVTADEAGRLSDGLELRTRVNGEVVQHGNTRDMIFSPESVISLVSRTFTLHPGDVLCTGTPEGVGYVRTPPRLLQPGDEVTVEVDRLGTLRTPITGGRR